jgi:NAD(P)-dependent dehydrogenase (short-subunit alcohol dehydrogenase family)
LVEVLEKEIGHRGASVNSIVPTAIEGVGVYGDGVSAEFRNFIKSFRPIQQMGRPSDVANVGEYRAGDLAAFVWAASACYWWCTGLDMRTKLLADLTTKESETILIKRMLFLTP